MPAPTKWASMQVGRGLGQERIVLGNKLNGAPQKVQKDIVLPNT